jgi:hypothetical protein
MWKLGYWGAPPSGIHVNILFILEAIYEVDNVGVATLWIFISVKLEFV